MEMVVDITSWGRLKPGGYYGYGTSNSSSCPFQDHPGLWIFLVGLRMNRLVSHKKGLKLKEEAQRKQPEYVQDDHREIT
jgi:hypothetical protein